MVEMNRELMAKKKRLEKGIYIDNDYTKEERKVQRLIRIKEEGE